MTPENFVYWLNGLLEIGEVKELNEKQVQIIKDHIKLVLKKETPSYTATTTQAGSSQVITHSDVISGFTGLGAIAC